MVILLFHVLVVLHAIEPFQFSCGFLRRRN